MSTTNYKFLYWNPGVVNGAGNTDYFVQYQKWDVIQGTGAGDTRYFYATIDNSGANPAASFFYAPSQLTRQDDIVTMSFTQTGTTFFQPGSIVVISGLTPNYAGNPPNYHYTGICIDAGSGYVKYLSPGWYDVAGLGATGCVMAPIHPAWTTGFYWVPSYSTDVSHGQIVVETALGEGYSQRFSPVINSNSFAWNLIFNERTDKESRALAVFVQDHNGVVPFVINFPVSKLYNLNGLKYLGKGLRQGLSSNNLNNTQFTAQQVFDIG